MEQNRNDVLHINQIAKDWMEEGLTITRVMGLLLSYLPTFRPNTVIHVPAQDQKTLWYRLYPHLLWPKFEPYLEERDPTMNDALHPLTGYCLPTCPRNKQWYVKDLNARLLLREIWAEYTRVMMMQVYMNDGSPEQWVVDTRKVAAATKAKDPEVEEPGYDVLLARNTKQLSEVLPKLS